MPGPRSFTKLILGTDAAWAKLLNAVVAHPSLHTFCTAHRAVWRCAHEQVAMLEESLDFQQTALQQDLAALNNPASGHIPGELEAYLNLKHDLQEVTTMFEEITFSFKKIEFKYESQ